MVWFSKALEVPSLNEDGEVTIIPTVTKYLSVLHNTFKVSNILMVHSGWIVFKNNEHNHINVIRTT